MATIGIDLDGTLVDGHTPLEGAKHAINLFREKGHRVIIHSCNNAPWIKKILENADIRYDAIWEGHGKPVCDCYLDDKGVQFRNWSQAIEDVFELLGRNVKS